MVAKRIEASSQVYTLTTNFDDRNTLMILKCKISTVRSLSYEVESLQRVATYWEEKICHGLPWGLSWNLRR